MVSSATPVSMRTWGARPPLSDHHPAREATIVSASVWTVKKPTDILTVYRLYRHFTRHLSISHRILQQNKQNKLKHSASVRRLMFFFYFDVNRTHLWSVDFFEVVVGDEIKGWNEWLTSDTLTPVSCISWLWQYSMLMPVHCEAGISHTCIDMHERAWEY